MIHHAVLTLITRHYQWNLDVTKPNGGAQSELRDSGHTQSTNDWAYVIEPLLSALFCYRIEARAKYVSQTRPTAIHRLQLYLPDLAQTDLTLLRVNPLFLVNQTSFCYPF